MDKIRHDIVWLQGVVMLFGFTATAPLVTGLWKVGAGWAAIILGAIACLMAVGGIRFCVLWAVDEVRQYRARRSPEPVTKDVAAWAINLAEYAIEGGAYMDERNREADRARLARLRGV